jgi:hypothetical protein
LKLVAAQLKATEHSLCAEIELLLSNSVHVICEFLGFHLLPNWLCFFLVF